MRGLVIGNSDESDAQPVLSLLWQLVEEGDLEGVSGAESPSAVSAGEWNPPPDLIVVLQHWPDEYTRADVARLIDACPLSRLVCCYGPWCESDGRSRNIWPIALRVPMSAAEGRIRHELAVLRGERTPHPLTASRDESLLSIHAELRPQQSSAELAVAVWSADPDMQRSLCEVLKQFGCTLIDGDDSPAVVLCDVDPWCQRIQVQLDHLRGVHPEAPIVGLAGLVHPGAVARMTPAGIDRVVSKHAPLQDLIATLREAAATGKEASIIPFGTADHSSRKFA